MSLSFHQLSSDSRKVDLAGISGLIYDTDPYIYQAMFRSREDAIAVLSELLPRGEDEMFRLENLFVAEDDDGIQGIVLWKKGPLRWSSAPLKEAARKVGVSLCDTLNLVSENYFSEYSYVDKNTIVVLNVCTLPRGAGIGSHMLAAFVREYKSSPMMLHVLADNDRAIRLYKKNGFTKANNICQGFSVENWFLPCYEMRRKGGRK